ncbi:ATP-dependent protease LonB [Paenibacillus naphthalenovorans]|uniref:ATP-dependent protease LonB n=1 Tax=Paenibacillus naphthalenovorans TaxID=162209 RepID=UPI0010B12FCC|nr:ATP-dependent protease LonB [Paenibacillus naphthalenovorans]GCL73107.1 ATP-dependent protease LonB [Paenibacillus naphthalenovorans]
MGDFVNHLFAAVMDRFAKARKVAQLEHTISSFIRYQEKRGQLYQTLRHFANDPRWVLRYVVGREIGRFLDDEAEEVIRIWMRLAADKHLYVREATAKGMVSAMEADFDRVWRFWESAFHDDSAEVRQTAAMTLIPLLQNPVLRKRLLPLVKPMGRDASPKVKALFERYLSPHLLEEEPFPVPAMDFKTTADLPVASRLIDQVVGQDEAVAIIRLAARQKRSVLLIGEPGTGKSMLGQAMAELLPASNLEDIIVEARGKANNMPKVRVLSAGHGEAVVRQREREFRTNVSSLRWILGFAGAVTLIVGAFYAYTRENPVYIMGSLILTVMIVWFAKSLKAKPSEQIPNYLVNNSGKVKAPFIDATGLHAGALLGDVRHDPYQSGGLESKPHHLVEPGAIHLAHKGVLFIDEVAMLSLESQQALLTAFQEKKLAITGRSPGSSGTMVRTEPVPSDFVMVVAGNVPDVDKIHPALRSRIRGYGYEVYMNETMSDTEENRYKLALFVAQEIRRDGKIPHFTREAVEAVIECARRIAECPDRLSTRFRELGGRIRSAGDLAVQSGAALVLAEHVKRAGHFSRSIEEQRVWRERNGLKPLLRQPSPGKIKVLSNYKETAGQIIQIWTAVVPAAEVEIRVPQMESGEWNVLPIEAALNRYCLSGRYYFETEGAAAGERTEDFTLAMALSALSAKHGVFIPEDLAVCGSLNVAGMVGECAFFGRKMLTAKHGGIRTILAPLANKHIEVPPTIHVVWVQSLDEAWNAVQLLTRTKLERDSFSFEELLK